MTGVMFAGLLLMTVYMIGAWKRERGLVCRGVIWKRIITAAGYFFCEKIIYPYGKRNTTEHPDFQRMKQLARPEEAERVWKLHQAQQYGMIAAAIWFVFLSGTMLSIWNQDEDVLNSYELNRPSYGEAADRYSWNVRMEDGSREKVDFYLEAQIYSREEAEAAFETCYSALTKKVKGENSSLQEIQKDLDFSVDDNWKEMEITWSPADYDMITAEGNILWDNLKEGANESSLYLNMRYEDYSRNFTIPVVILKEKEQSGEKLQSYLEKQEQENREKGLFQLPKEFQGQKVLYIKEKNPYLTAGVMLLIAAVFLLLIYKKHADLKKRCMEREKQMKQDYPKVISKLLILIRAGMPVRSAWKKMVLDYHADRKKGGTLHYAFEEMSVAEKEMNSGISEGTAYLRFGRRCGNHLYLKLGSLLEQNLKKGNHGISILLENERLQAMEDRKRQIRAEGELAGTKLMMPMIVLFALVMAIILVPAFMSFNF